MLCFISVSVSVPSICSIYNFDLTFFLNNKMKMTKLHHSSYLDDTVSMHPPNLVQVDPPSGRDP